MAHRFYLTTPIHGNLATLVGDEAHHALNVMRFRLGDTVILFDGNGNEYDASILETGKKQIRLQINETRTANRLLPLVVIASALPKGDRQKVLIEKSVELGVDEFIPLSSQRAVSFANENAIYRIRKMVVEASKQCERNLLMNIGSPLDVHSLISTYSGKANTLCLFADPHAKLSISELEVDRPECFVVAVGPEGGFSPLEQEEFANARWIAVRMGPTILRVETAAIYAAVILSSKRDRIAVQVG